MHDREQPNDINADEFAMLQLECLQMLQLHQGRGKLNARVFAQVVSVQTKTDLHTQSKIRERRRRSQ